MASLYHIFRSTYGLIVPKHVRDAIRKDSSLLSSIVLRVERHLQRSALHDEVYDETYFQSQDIRMKASAAHIVRSLQTTFNPSCVIDVGCGSGSVIAELRDLGIGAVGLEYADAAISICRKKGLDVRKYDLEQPVDFGQTAPLVLSTEVAEHLPESCADGYVALLCHLSTRVIVMSAATPGQGGMDHVNEQPHAYWIKKMAGRGFRFDQDETRRLREDWKAHDVDIYRAKNIMVFIENRD